MARHPVLTTLAVLFAATSTLYGAIWIYTAHRNEERTAYLGLDIGSESKLEVGAVPPGTPAERAGLRRGDRIVAVNGIPLTTVAPLANALLRGRPGDRVLFTVERGGHSAPLSLEAVLGSPPGFRQKAGQSLPQRFAAELLHLYPVFFLIVSVPVLLLRAGDPNAWRLAVLFTAFIAMAPAFELELPDSLRRFWLAYKVAFHGTFHAVFLYFFSVFPAPSPLDRKAPWLKWLWLAVGLLASLPLAALGLRAGGLAPILRVMDPHADGLTSPIELYRWGGLTLGLVSLVSNAFWAETSVQRKSRVLLAGMVVGLAPGKALHAVAAYTKTPPYEFPFWIWAPTILALALIPIAFAYAVVKHRVLEIPLLLRRSARYVLVQRGSLGVLLLLGIAATLFFARAFDGVTARRAQTAATSLAVGFGTLLVWTGSHVHRRVRSRIDRAFFRSAYDARLILDELASRIPATTSRDGLAQLLSHYLATALMPRSLAVYLEEDDGRLRLLRGAGPGTLAASLPSLTDLARRGQPRELAVDHAETGLTPLGADWLVPMVGRDGRLTGLIVLGPRRSEEPYSREDKRLLASVASQAGIALESLRLAERMGEHLAAERRAAHEMELARAVQSRLLPARPVRLGTLECMGCCVQARPVGGDYYDFLELGQGRLGLVIADISGKGFPAALLMASVHASVRSRSAEDLLDLPRQLHAVNQLLYRSSDAHRYATFFLGIYDDSRRHLRYANCGHNPPIVLRRSGGVERLSPSSPVLGLFEDWECATGDVDLGTGDLVVLFSDGITEAFSDAGEEFGDDRLIELARAHGDLPIGQLLDAVMAGVRAFSKSEQADDQTLVLARAR